MAAFDLLLHPPGLGTSKGLNPGAMRGGRKDDNSNNQSPRQAGMLSPGLTVTHGRESGKLRVRPTGFAAEQPGLGWRLHHFLEARPLVHRAQRTSPSFGHCLRCGDEDLSECLERRNTTCAACLTHTSCLISTHHLAEIGSPAYGRHCQCYSFHLTPQILSGSRDSPAHHSGHSVGTRQVQKENCDPISSKATHP